MKSKTLITFFILAILAIPTRAQADAYVAGGASVFKIDGEFIDSSLGLRVGVGFNFNQTWGIEATWDNAPSRHISDEILVGFNQTSSYLSCLGTVTFPISDKFSFIGKAGNSQYEFDSSSRHLSNKDVSAVASLGLLIPVKASLDLEIWFTSFFDTEDKVYKIKSASINGTYRYKF